MQYTMQELSEAAGVPGRTIRYYISEGLLQGPTMLGSKANYTEEHRQKLEKIKKQKEQGQSLQEIQFAQLQDFGIVLPEPVCGCVWEEYLVANNMWFRLKVGCLPPHKKRQVLKILAKFIKSIKEEIDK